MIQRFVMALLILVGSAAATFMVLQGGLFGTSHERVKDAVAAELRDPASAQFRNMTGSGETHCGEVNGKNAFGAYSGFRKFAHKRGVTIFEPLPTPGANMSEQADYYDELARFTELQTDCLG